MIVWTAVMGALIGWIMAGFDGWGMFPGGLVGALAGLGLRAAVRSEIERAVQQLRSEMPAPVPVAPEPMAAAPPARTTLRAPVVERTPGPALEEPVEPAAEVLPEPVQPGALETALAAARDWLFGGNTVVRLGLVILFVGLSFLIRYAAAAGLFPIELRLAAVGLAGAALLAIGFRTRTKRPGFGLALQGAGVGVIYMTIFAALKLVPGFPMAAAFALMVLVCAFGCALALLQGSQALVLTAFAGGFATPLLLSDGSGDPAGLFGYYTLLNLAILFIASRRAWRMLNLLGFFASFGIATLWMAGGYTPAQLAVTQAFVGASVLIYLAAALLFARRTPGRLGAVVDTTLLFGPALAGFGLEVALVGDRPFGSAFAAIGFAALYLGVAAMATRRIGDRFRVLHEAMLAIGIGFVTMAVPLALGARWTSATWALEGAGAVWIGARQARWVPRLFGLALQAVAALLFLRSIGPNIDALPLANAGFVGAMLIAGALLGSAWWLRRPLASPDSQLGRRYAGVEAMLPRPLFLLGFFFWWLAWTLEATRLVPGPTDPDVPLPVFPLSLQLQLPMLAFVASAGLWRWIGQRADWEVARWPSLATLPALAFGFLAMLSAGRHLLFAPDWIVWAVAIGIHVLLLRLNDRDDVDGRYRRVLAATHVGGVWLGIAMLADCLWLGIDRAQLWNTSWAGVVLLVSVTAMLLVLTLWAGRALGSVQRSWPLDRHAVGYAWTAAIPAAALVAFGVLWTALDAAGETSPLPYWPLLNPVDLALGLGVVVLLLWRRTLLAAELAPSGAEQLRSPFFLAGTGLLIFTAVNTAWFRLAHQWLAVAWTPEALLGDETVQTGLAIIWTLIALTTMVAANRRGVRPLWLAGAGLLGLTVVKLVLVDLGGSGGGSRIIAFIGVGALMLVLGYLAPLPPRREEATA
ncbi:DUF2339 domain-containing protein [Sphingomonas sp.]|jgi:uncharacterized membrane protein|uniref:DUF2339 domain-containing protein n=1 Tax=Sphingomonas sp. TaxID=28214 RepID=UPI002DECA84C|nr:DUF2339 domain-containing protein [Sphingomonas sp.]